MTGLLAKIWSEGQIPFAHMSDGGIIIALSGANPNAARAMPYTDRPCDKAGAPMPKRLWDLVQWCFKLDAANRPTVDVIADTLSEISLAESRASAN
jgi:hypothetical protein